MPGQMSQTSQSRMPAFPLLSRAWPPLLGGLIVLFLVGLRRSMYTSFDTYFHLRFGQEFLTDWSARSPGQVGPSASADWLPTQWLSQIAMAWTFDHIGATALGVIFLALMAAIPAGVYLLARAWSGPGVSSLITAIITVELPYWLSLRPQLFSFLLCIALVALWQRARNTGRAPWLLIPLGWLWAMLHGMWIMGVLISVLAAVGLSWETRPGARRSAGYFAVPGGMFLLALLTPAGPGLVGAVVSVGARSSHFGEWAAPAYTEPRLWLAAILIGATFLLAAHGRGLSPFDLTMLATIGGLALYSERTVPLALILCAPIAAQLLTTKAPSARPVVGRAEKGFLVAGIAAVAIAGAVNGSVTEPGVASKLAPFEHRLVELPPGTPVLTDRPLGAALMWVHPDLGVLVHGYGDAYTDAELTRLDDMTDVLPGWDDTVRDLGATVALLPEDSALGYALEGEGWERVEIHRDTVWLTAPETS